MKKTSGSALARKLGISASRGMEAVIKAKLITAVAEAAKKQNVTHAQLANKSGLPRSAVTGILSGSLQKVTIDRILKLVDALNLTVDIKVKKSA